MKIKITSDSTCDLEEEQIEQNGIGIFRLSVILGEKSYKDGEISPEDIFEFVKNSGTLPKTAAGSQSEYSAFFAENLQGFDSLIHYNISAQASSSHSAACKAAEEFGGKVFVIDSKALSTGQGLL
ncbi:MAG: DegV family protein, partial [Clostridia bacterium]|nr:DegV family protein [Clostridia bacterium]